jgi:tRNA pseudouridine55 synthase
MNGIINVLKPTDMTSHDVVAVLRRLLHFKKIGHTGTLDPMAVGVLPICIGRATKVVEHLTNDQKTYRCELKFGESTDTQDRWGVVLETSRIRPSLEEIEAVLPQFIGEIDQIPPMYSALKVDGKKLVDLAREGIVVERKARRQTIHELKIVRVYPEGLCIDVTCSKGTYVRTICHDLGEALGSHAHMTSLIRMKSGVFNISEALTLEEVSHYVDSGRVLEILQGLDTPFKHMQSCNISKFVLAKLLNGIKIDLGSFLSEKPEADCSIRLYCENDFIGIGFFEAATQRLTLEKRLYSGDES